MDPPPGLRNKILLVPIKVLYSILSGNLNCVSKKPDTYDRKLEFTKVRYGIIHITKGLFTLQNL